MTTTNKLLDMLSEAHDSVDTDLCFTRTILYRARGRLYDIEEDVKKMLPARRIVKRAIKNVENAMDASRSEMKRSISYAIRAVAELWQAEQR